MLQITNSTDQQKVNKIRLNELKEMVESFSIKEEKFIKETYYVSLDVSFNKKILNYLKRKMFSIYSNIKNFFIQ